MWGVVMKANRRIFQGITLLAVMTVALLDINTAKDGAAEGIQLCIQSVVPSLFPFIFLSLLLTSRLYGVPMAALSPFSKLGLVPRGCESILLMAFLGGYPIGAQTIYNAWMEGSLDTKTAKRLLGFCNNAGPSFIFGILSNAFTNKAAAWYLWLIHIVSALIVGWIIPCDYTYPQDIRPTVPLSATNALKKTVSAMVSICSWIIVVRTVLSFTSKYLFRSCAPAVSVIISGLTELTNGCLQLSRIPNEPMRFMIASGLLSSGGLCVYLQTRAVTGELGTGMYLQGKTLQTLISLILSGVSVRLLYDFAFPPKSWLLFLCGSILLILAALAIKKSCSNLEKAVV